MNRYLFGLIGLTAFGLSSLMGESLAFGGGSCCPEPTCCPEAGCNGGCNGGCDCDHYCPRCGCRLEACCHPTCETKKETVHKYCCKCKEICIPGVTPICCANKGGCCDNSGACNGGCTTACDPCNDGCCDGGNCHCRLHCVHKLMVCPQTKEHCVRGCTVTYTCPHCGDCCNGGCATLPATNVVPAAPGQTAPAAAPAPATKLPPPPKVTSTSAIEEIGTAQAGF
jgi:hypothetical protein